MHGKSAGVSCGPRAEQVALYLYVPFVGVTNNAVIGVALGYLEEHPDEADLLRALIVLALHGPPVTTRNTTPAHVTCSAAVVTPDWRMLQVRQRPSLVWRLPGGHVDADDASLLGAALRHLTTKAGIEANTVIPAGVMPIEVGAYPVDASQRLSEPEHVHYDFCFLLYVEDCSVQHNVGRAVSHRWVPVEDVPGRLGAKLKAASAKAQVAL